MKQILTLELPREEILIVIFQPPVYNWEYAYLFIKNESVKNSNWQMDNLNKKMFYNRPFLL